MIPMKGLPFALLLCLLTVAFVPSASAAADAGPECMEMYRETYLGGPYWLVQRDTCSAQVYECPDGYSPPAPPCQEVGLTASAALGPPDLNEWPKCVPIAIGNLCSSIYWPGCNLWIEWTAIPHTPTCLYSTGGLLEASALTGVQSPPNCLPYYREFEAGPITVIQGGCGNDVRLCADGQGDDSLLTVREIDDVKRLDTSCVLDLPPIYCSDIYARHEIGPVAIVVTSGCSAHVELCDTPVLTRVDVSCMVTIAAPPEPQTASQPFPPVPDPEQPICQRQGMGEMQSMYCVNAWDTDCAIYYQRSTGVGGEWRCYPSGEGDSNY